MVVSIVLESANIRILFMPSQLHDVVYVKKIWELVDVVFEVSKKRLVNEAVDTVGSKKNNQHEALVDF